MDQFHILFPNLEVQINRYNMKWFYIMTKIRKSCCLNKCLKSFCKIVSFNVSKIKFLRRFQDLFIFVIILIFSCEPISNRVSNLKVFFSSHNNKINLYRSIMKISGPNASISYAYVYWPSSLDWFQTASKI